MARFIIHTYPEKKKFQKPIQIIVVLGLAALFVFDIASYIWGGNRRYLGSILIFLFLLSHIDRLRRKKREYFINISDDSIEWLIAEEGDITKVDWNDIRWIKREKDNSLSLFQESSFSKNFSLKKFSEEDSKEILQLLEKKGLDRNIRLINFSEPALVVA